MRMSDQKLNLRFVQEVEKREVLYNFNLPGYSRKDVVEKAWQEVADEINLPIAECREKWRNVRTVFIRKRKPSPKGCQSRRKAYYLADAMKFCLPFIKVLAPPEFRKSILAERQEQIMMKPEKIDDDESCYLEDITEITQEEQEEDQERDQEREQEQEHQSIEPEYFEQKKPNLDLSFLNGTQPSSNNERKDALKMFLLSLIPEVETFTDSQIKQFKRRIFSVIDEISGISYSNMDPLNNLTMSSVSKM